MRGQCIDSSSYNKLKGREKENSMKKCIKKENEKNVKEKEKNTEGGKETVYNLLPLYFCMVLLLFLTFNMV